MERPNRMPTSPTEPRCNCPMRWCPVHLSLRAFNLEVRASDDDGTGLQVASCLTHGDAVQLAAAPELLNLLRRAVPMLIRLGDFAHASDAVGRPTTEEERCAVVGEARQLLWRLTGEPCPKWEVSR